MATSSSFHASGTVRNRSTKLHSRRSIAILGAALIVLASAPASFAAPLNAVASSAPLGLGVSVDFLWNPNPGDDTQVFLHMTNMAFRPNRDEVTSIFKRVKEPERNFPVLLFLATESNRPLSEVWKLRAKGLSWVEVMARLRVPRERVFVELKRQPGPPYGKAYGHHKTHPHDPAPITDDDIYYWVNVRTMSTFFHVDPTSIVESRGSGKSWKSLAGSKFRKNRVSSPEGKKIEAAGMSTGKPDTPPGQAKGKGKGHKK
jgi:hypothetical protein